MTARWRWPVAGVLSVALHGGAAIGLAASLAPRPPPDQTPPEARLDLATYRVERSEAREAEAAADPAEESAAGGTALSGGTVPVSRARPAAPSAEPARVLGRDAPAAALEATPVRSQAAAAVAAPGTTVAAAPPAPVRLAGVAPGASAAATLRPAAEGVVPAAFRPEAAASGEAAGEAVVAVAPESPRGASPAPRAAPAANLPATGDAARRADPGAREARQAEPPAVPAREARPPAEGAAPRTLPAETATAALAWSGGAETEVDPVSLAAIQSFMRAGDAAAAGDPVRDGIGGLLASVPCARLQTAFDPMTGGLELRGHVPEDGLRAPVLAALRAQVGAAIPVTGNVRILPRPQCGALSGIAAVGLPQSEAQERDPKVVGEGAHARVYTFSEGERLRFELEGPDYPSVFYVDYFDAEGMVLHLQPNEHVPLLRVAAKERVEIGASEDADAGLAITVGPPFGQEIMVAFAASRPLFEAPRPIREPADPYLAMLAGAVQAARASDPDFKGEWVYFFVETRAR